MSTQTILAPGSWAFALDLSLGLISPGSKLLETKLLDLSLLLGSESLLLGSELLNRDCSEPRRAAELEARSSASTLKRMEFKSDATGCPRSNSVTRATPLLSTKLFRKSSLGIACAASVHGATVSCVTSRELVLVDFVQSNCQLCSNFVVVRIVAFPEG